MSRIIDKLSPFMVLLPQVVSPTYRVQFKERITWTMLVLILFLICSQVPLYGMSSIEGSDPLYWMRLILASNRGSLTELGITPSVTSSMLVQMFIGAGILDVDMSLKSDRALVNGAQKLLAIVIALGQALVSVWSGVYGPTAGMSNLIIATLVLQLVVASMMTTLMDDVLTKGYGFGSGISLFIATNICENIVWRCFSPTTISTGRGVEFQGAVVSMVHLLFSRKDKMKTLRYSFTRTNLPNMFNVFSTILVLLLVVYLQGFQLNIPLRSTTQRGYQASYPVKLFYTSSMPITLFSAFVSNFFFLSQLLYRHWPKNLIVRLMGVWGSDESTISNTALGGISYLLTPPTSWKSTLSAPIHFFFHVLITLASCAVLSGLWCEISGSSARDISKQLKERGLVVTGHRDGPPYRELKRVISIAAIFGGMCIGALCVFADLFGAIGSGTSILIAVSIIYHYIDIIRANTSGEM